MGTARVALAESLMFFHCCCVIGNGDDDEIFTSDFPRNFYMAYGIARDTEMQTVLIFFILLALLNQFKLRLFDFLTTWDSDVCLFQVSLKVISRLSTTLQWRLLRSLV